MGELFQPWHLLILLFPLIFFAVIIGGVVLLVRGSNAGRSRATFRESVLNVVPRAARRVALALFCVALLIGLIYGFVGGHSQMMSDHAHGHFPAYGPYLPVLISLVCMIPGAFIGCLFAVWMLALGYVYGDARRRGMPPILWLLVALLVPNLLGFLLYFVLRKPFGLPCTRCGQAVTPEQRFCPWCGQPAPMPSANPMSPTQPTGPLPL